MPSAACCRREPTTLANRRNNVTTDQLCDVVVQLGRGWSGPWRVARREVPRDRQQLVDDWGVNDGWPRQIPSMRRADFPLVRDEGSMPEAAKIVSRVRG